jgi:hypothetical protein
VASWTVSLKGLTAGQRRTTPSGARPSTPRSAGDATGIRGDAPSAGVHWGYFTGVGALAAASLGAAIGLYYETREINQDFRADPSQIGLRKKGLRYEDATNAMIGVAAAAGATAVLLAFFTRWRSGETPHIAVMASPVRGGGVLSLRIVR